jgi:DNA-binding transcriptional LysR family regulator
VTGVEADDFWSSGGWLQGRRRTRAARSAGFTPSVAFQTDDYPATLALIATGLGVALLPAISLLNLSRDIRIRQVSSPSLTRHIAGATASGHDHPPAVKAMLQTLHQTASRSNVDDLASATSPQP